jgi:hypothetical protein
MKKKHLETQFVRFIIEKYGKEPNVDNKKENDVEDDESDDFIEDDESIEDDERIEDKTTKKRVNKKDDEDSIIDELLTEYKDLKKQYDKVYNKRK